MSTGTIDTLQIEIETSSNNAAAQIDELTKALRRLKKQADKGTGLEKVKADLNGINIKVNKTTKAFNAIKSGLKLISFRQVVNYLGGAVTSINDYVENLNLFQVSMRGFYKEAYDYAMLVNEKLGVDPSAWMRTQGVFMSMGRGFGMTEKQAYNLSESLTELSYDIGSLYNEDVETASLRLQSALAGEIEPIRRLGISISQATLQEYALSKGIDESVASMTEQEKALLRSLKLIEGASDIGAIGDFARTLESPANALRVFSQQIEQMRRAIGSVLLPIIVQVLPYMQAFVNILTDAISRLATLLNLEMPSWDNSAWDNAYSGAADAVDDTTAAVKKLKRETIGIDELNILGDKSGSGDVGGVSGWASSLEIPELWNKEAIAAIETKAKELEGMLKTVLEVAVLIGGAFAAWKISPLIYSGIGTVTDLLGSIGKKSTVVTPKVGKLKNVLKFAGIAGAIWIVVERFIDLYENNENFRKGVERTGQVLDGLKTVAGDVFGGIKSWLEEIGVGFEDFGLVALGTALMFVPGGKIPGSIILGFEAVSFALKKLGGVSDEEWYLMTEDMHDWWYKTKISALELRLDLEEKFKKISKGFREMVDGFKNSFQSAIDELKRKWESFKSWWSGKKNLQVDVTSYKTGGDDNSAWKNNFASGGFPDHGQMFIARESGPELVGQIGRRTAVANNDQIVAGIAQGVANANGDVVNAIYAMAQQIVRAVNEQSGDIYLDYDKVGRKMTQYASDYARARG